MKCAKLKIEMENQAFSEDANYEVSRILKELADKIENRGIDTYVLHDINGNNVGEFEIGACVRKRR